MNTLWFHLLVYIGSFLAIWAGSGFVLTGITSLAKSWRLPPFALSFFLLGMLTSLPEMSIGAAAIFDNDPTIFVGNLLGGVLVLILLVIPLQAIFGSSLHIPKALTMKDILLMLVVIGCPALLTEDQKLTPFEGVLMIIIYGLLFLFISKEQSLATRLSDSFHHKSKHWTHLLFKMVLGVVMLFLASQQIIRSTTFFADYFHIAPFFMSLIVVSLGTSIPELSIVVRSRLKQQNTIALADYLGSAAANTILLGIMLVVYGQPVLIPNHFAQRLFFLAGGLGLFYVFARSHRTLTRKESLVLLAGYIGFIITEILILK